MAPGVTVHHRDDLISVQTDLANVEGVSVLIYDQTCAAEKRRRRKRGAYPDPPKRMFINEAVCEGCGDCSRASNCISVEPLETELGRKRQINQSSCNKDYSCNEGFCPSFVTVEDAVLRKREASDYPAAYAGLPEPEPRSPDGVGNIVVTGIGGTGVVTVGALLGMAAHLEGKGASVLDSIGLAQKNGAVVSYIRVAPSPDDVHSARIPIGQADCLIACDVVVAAGKETGRGAAARDRRDPQHARGPERPASSSTATSISMRPALAGRSPMPWAATTCRSSTLTRSPNACSATQSPRTC